MHPDIFPSILSKTKQKKSLKKKPHHFSETLPGGTSIISQWESQNGQERSHVKPEEKIRNVKTNQTLIPLLD